MISASDQLYLKTLGQRPRTFVDKTITNEFFLTNPAEKRWHSLDLRILGSCASRAQAEDERRDHCIESITAYIFIEWHGQGH